MELELCVTPKQRSFIEAAEDEVLFGGAAGGGKSMGQMLDALLYALRYSGSRQLILRRTLPELDKTLVRVALQLYPKSLYSYTASSHTGLFANGSALEFGYCDSEEDVHRYQSAEYDVIRFDELTHFTGYMYLYLLSRLRGSNGYPKQVKSTTNPGGPGHSFVRERFIDLGAPMQTHRTPTGTRRFIPARVTDNSFLMKKDPGYATRLLNLPENERRALLDGAWELEDGRFFPEFRRETHVLPSGCPPAGWTRYVSIDYGLDMFAACLFAVDGSRAVQYREVYQSSLIISDAARLLLSALDRPPAAVFAPPDLWNRRQETGVSAAEIFQRCGVTLTRAPAARASGWLALKELLKPPGDGSRPALCFTEDCPNTIRSLLALRCDCHDPGDAAGRPHEVTHAPDALRYFAASRRGEPLITHDSELDSLLSYGI